MLARNLSSSALAPSMVNWSLTLAGILLNSPTAEEMKELCIDVFTPLVQDLPRRRSAITPLLVIVF